MTRTCSHHPCSSSEGTSRAACSTASKTSSKSFGSSRKSTTSTPNPRTTASVWQATTTKAVPRDNPSRRLPRTFRKPRRRNQGDGAGQGGPPDSPVPSWVAPPTAHGDRRSRTSMGRSSSCRLAASSNRRRIVRCPRTCPALATSASLRVSRRTGPSRTGRTVALNGRAVKVASLPSPRLAAR
jgi:hypothetical protein